MNVRRPVKVNKNTHCRMCHSECYAPLREIRNIIAESETRNFNDPEYNAVLIQCEEQEERINKYNRESHLLFAIEADTAQGTQLEMICQRHLLEVGNLFREFSSSNQ